MNRAESFNSVLRRECPSHHLTIELKDAQSVLNRWRADYKSFHPHGSLGPLRRPTSPVLEQLEYSRY